jgi:hypothetical protein
MSKNTGNIFLRKERKGKGNKMKRITEIKKCRECGGIEWSKKEKSEHLYFIKDGEWNIMEVTPIKEYYQCRVCGTKTYTDPLSETYVQESVEPQLTIEERDGHK